MQKKLLIIAYNFPPLSGMRSIRWVNFIKHLVRGGYKVDVLTIDPEEGIGNYDRGCSKFIPVGVNVYRTYPGPFHKYTYRHFPIKINGMTDRRNGVYGNFKIFLRKWLKKIHKNTIEHIFIPDKIVEWLPWGLKMGRKLIKENKYDAIISSAPPFTSNILAYYLKKWAKVPWIADYGDPWSFNPMSFKWRHLIDKKIEKILLEKIDYLIVTTENTLKGFLKYYPFLKPEKLKVISNGYDVEEIENIKPERGNKFRIVYTGIFYDKIREPYIFFDAIKKLNHIDFEVLIAGDILPHFIEIAKKKGIDKKIVFIGHQSHNHSISLQKGADVLLLLLNKSQYQTPGKISEYFGACCPILAVQFDKKNTSAKLIEKYNRGIVVNNDHKEIAFAIQKMYDFWKEQKLKSQFNLKSLKEYSWTYQVDKLKRIIELCRY